MTTVVVVDSIVHLDGEMHVTGDMGEDGHCRQGHQDSSHAVTRYPAWDRSHQHLSAGQCTVQVESHTGEENTKQWLMF